MDLQLPFELLAAAITLLVMLYLLFGDNPFFRVVSYSFVGVAAGYVLVLVIFQVLIPRLIEPLMRGILGGGITTEFWLALLTLIFGILMLFKLSPRLSFIGNVSMAVLVGVGAAVAIGGAVFGTLFGQIGGVAATFPSAGDLITAGSPDAVLDAGGRLVEGLFVLAGTICTLLYFQFSATRKPNQAPQRGRLVEILGGIGQVFIGITLGATFAGVFAASIAAFIERLGFLITLLSRFV